MKKIMLLIAFLLSLGVIVPTAPVLADGPNGGAVIFGEDFVLESGGVLKGDLIVFGGDVTLEKNSQVKGSVMVTGGEAEIAGKVKGDVVIFGGDLKLESTASVGGDAAVFGGDLEIEEGAVVKGELIEGLGSFPLPFGPLEPPKLPEPPRAPEPPKPPRPPTPYIPPRTPRRFTIGLCRETFFESTFGTLFGFIKTVFVSLILTVLALLTVLFLPRQVVQVGDVILNYPWHSLAWGLLTLIVGVGLGALLIITVCLSPGGVLVWLAILIAGLFGWVAIGLLVGEKLLVALKLEEPVPVVAAVIGVLLISLLAWSPCCIGLIFVVGAGSLGLGAVVLTRFGTEDYPPPNSTPPRATE
jgi:hypothetical protein